jgi:type IV fimbrial biogenesis protein FimT
MQLKQAQFGFTVTELMVVVAIAAILASIAAPSFSSFISNTHASSIMNQLTNDMNRARAEAIKRNSWVLLCVRNTAGTDCGAGTDWKSGWLVCADSEPDGSCDANTATNPNPISIRQAINTQFSLTGSAAAIRFNPKGTQGTGGIATVKLCCKSGSTTPSVASIAATGYISRQ